MSFLCWKSEDLALFDGAVNPSYPLSALPIPVCGLRGLQQGTCHEMVSVVRVLSPASNCLQGIAGSHLNTEQSQELSFG